MILLLAIFYPFVWFILGYALLKDIDKRSVNMQLFLPFTPHILFWIFTLVVIFGTNYPSFGEYQVFKATTGLLLGVLLALILRVSFPKLMAIKVLFKERFILLIVTVCTSISEEIVWRGFLLPSVSTMTGNSWIGLFASTILFSLTHLHQGLTGLVNHIITGLFFGIIFIVTGDITGAIVAHIVYNVFVICRDLYDNEKEINNEKTI